MDYVMHRQSTVGGALEMFLLPLLQHIVTDCLIVPYKYFTY